MLIYFLNLLKSRLSFKRRKVEGDRVDVWKKMRKEERESLEKIEQNV